MARCFVCRPAAAEFKNLFDGCDGIIRLVDIVPEAEGSRAFAEEVSRYCRVSLAHSTAP